MIKISVIILVKNNELTINKTLLSTVCFDEVLVIDTGSTDNTLEIARKYKNVKICKRKLINFGELRNEAALLAKNDWVFPLDSDEEITDDLIEEIKTLDMEDSFVIYSIPILNFYNKKLIKCCGWYPDNDLKIYNKKFINFKNNYVHESLALNKQCKIKKLKSFINHYSYLKIYDFLQKMQFYSDLFAKEFKNKKKASFYKAITHSIFSFFKNYFFKKGFLYGREGFLISFYISNTIFYKYLKLLEANSNKREW